MRSLPLACARPLRAGSTLSPGGRRSSPVVHEFAAVLRYPRAVPSPAVPSRRCAGRAGYHRAVTPLLLVAAGVVALVVAGLTLRTFGPRYRVGRLLATTPKVSVARPSDGRDGRRPMSASTAGSTPRTSSRTRTTSRSSSAGPPGGPRRGRWRRSRTRARSCRSRSTRASTRSASTRDALDAGLVVVAPRVGRDAPRDVADRAPAGIGPDDAGPGPDRSGLVGRARDRRSAFRSRASADGGAAGDG